MKLSQLHSLIREEVRKVLNEKLNFTKLKIGDRVYKERADGDVEYTIVNIFKNKREAVVMLKTKVSSTQFKKIQDNISTYDSKIAKETWYGLRDIDTKQYKILPQSEMKKWQASDPEHADRNKKGEYEIYTPNNKILFTISKYKYEQRWRTWYDNPKTQLKSDTMTIITPNIDSYVIGYLKDKKLIKGINYRYIATPELISNLSTIFKYLKGVELDTKYWAG